MRELARNMGIPAGTILARAQREHWTAQIANAKALAVRPLESPTITPTQAVALSMLQRGERHIGRMASITERAVDHIETIDGPEILNSVDDIEKLDKVARRTFGITDGDGQANVMVNIALLGISPERVSAEIEPSGD